MHATGPRLLARKCNEYVRERVGIFEWALLNEVVRKSLPMLASLVSLVSGWSVGWVCRHELTLFMWLESKALKSHDITHKRSPKNTEKKFQTKSQHETAERRAGKEKKSCQVSFVMIIFHTAFRMFPAFLFSLPSAAKPNSILKLESTCLGPELFPFWLFLMLKIKTKLFSIGNWIKKQAGMQHFYGRAGQRHISAVLRLWPNNEMRKAMRRFWWRFRKNVSFMADVEIKEENSIRLAFISQNLICNKI